MARDTTDKRAGILIAVLCVIMALILVLNAVDSVYKTIYNVYSYESKELRSNKRSFEKTAEILLEFYEEEKEKNGALEYMVVDRLTDGIWEITCVSDSKTDGEYVIFKEADGEEETAYRISSGSFNTGMYRGELYFSVRILDDRVVFLRELPHAVIYMKNGVRPSYIFSADEQYKSLYIDRISFNLFSTVGRS